jgi:hypothetical protein
MTWTEWLMFWTNTESNDTEDADDESGVSNATQRAVKTIVSKIDELSSKLQDRIATSEDRIDELEEQINEVDHDVDYEPDVKEDDFEALKARVDELEETIDGFTEVYEAISSQYNPLIDQQPSKPKQNAQPQPPTPEKEGADDQRENNQGAEPGNKSKSEPEPRPNEGLNDTPIPNQSHPTSSVEDQGETKKTPNKGSEPKNKDERNITIKDSLTDEKEEFKLGEKPSLAEEERRKQELQRTTDDDIEPRSKEDSVKPVLNEEHVEKTQEPSFGPEHASEHIDNPKLDTPEPQAQDTTEPVVTEQRQQPSQTPIQRDTPTQPAPQPSKDQNGVNEHTVEQGQSQSPSEKTAERFERSNQAVTNNEDAADNTSTEQESKDEEKQRSTIQNELIHQLIDKKRNNRDKLTRVSDDEEFYVDGHQPLRDILDLATVLTDDPDVFKHHVLKERNFEAWIENSLDKPGLADDLRHIRSREDYITTLLAAE